MGSIAPVRMALWMPSNICRARVVSEPPMAWATKSNTLSNYFRTKDAAISGWSRIAELPSVRPTPRRGQLLSDAQTGKVKCRLVGEAETIEMLYADECFDSTLKATSSLLPLLLLEGVAILPCFF